MASAVCYFTLRKEFSQTPEYAQRMLRDAADKAEADGRHVNAAQIRAMADAVAKPNLWETPT
jgi:hypothetical protein